MCVWGGEQPSLLPLVENWLQLREGIGREKPTSRGEASFAELTGIVAEKQQDWKATLIIQGHYICPRIRLDKNKCSLPTTNRSFE